MPYAELLSLPSKPSNPHEMANLPPSVQDLVDVYARPCGRMDEGRRQSARRRLPMKCTAHEPTAMMTDPPGKDTRCERELGHGGLHRYEYEYKGVKWIAEFPDKGAYFQTQRVGE